MPDYICNWCGHTMKYRKKRNVPIKKWIKSICGNTNDKDVHLMLVKKGGKRVKNKSWKNNR